MLVFTDKTYYKKGLDIFKRLQFRGDKHPMDITIPVSHVKEEHLYCEAVLTLKNGKQLQYPFAVELSDTLMNGHKADDVAEVEFNLCVTAFENALDFYGDDWGE